LQVTLSFGNFPTPSTPEVILTFTQLSSCSQPKSFICLKTSVSFCACWGFGAGSAFFTDEDCAFIRKL